MKISHPKIFIITGFTILAIVASLFTSSRLFAVTTGISDALIVTPTSINFDTVFPGEEHQYNFNVQLTDFFQKAKPYNTVTYQIEKKDPLTTLTLCNFTQQNIDPAEGENDTTASAKLNASQDDASDQWQGQLFVPAIAGQAAQNNSYGITSAAGLHECNLEISVTASETHLPIPTPPKPPKPPRPPSPWPIICKVFPQFEQCENIE